VREFVVLKIENIHQKVNHYFWRGAERMAQSAERMAQSAWRRAQKAE